MKSYVFIINPVSGNGKSKRVWAQVQARLTERNIPYRAYFTEYPGHAEIIARQIATEERDTVLALVAVGGDGTIHEVVNGAAATPDLPVTLIPAGSGNDYGRGFGVPKHALEALERLEARERERDSTAEQRVDLGRYRLGAGREGHFINGIGIGFDGEIAKVTNESWYKRWFNRVRLGRLAYILTVFRLLFSYRTHDVEITIDGRTHRFSRVWLIAVSNIPYYGGGMMINPGAVHDDGLFNVCVVHDLSRWKLFAVFGTVFSGAHTRYEEVTMLAGRQITVQSAQPMTIHADGEIIGTTPVEVDVLRLGRSIL